MNRYATAFLLVLAAMLCFSACGDDDSSGQATDTDTDGDTDGDTDTDTDTDTDGDTDTDTDTDGDGGNPVEPNIAAEKFTRHTVDDTTGGPAYTSVGDVTGDGYDDIVVSFFGPPTDFQMRGSVVVYEYDGDLDSWISHDVISQATDLKFPNQTTLADLDGDFDLDIIVPAGFLACTMGGLAGGCGSLSWFENDGASGDGTSWTRQSIIDHGSDLFYHKAILTDLDGDGVDDLMTVGEEMGGGFPATPDEAVAGWFKGITSGVRFELTPKVMGSGLGSLPVAWDVDGDSDTDFASAEYFVENGSFAWMEQVSAPSTSDPAGVWTRHVIDDTVGPSIKLAIIDDLFGDGVARAVGSNHTNTNDGDPESAVYVYDIPSTDPTQAWSSTKISDGIVSVPGTMMAPMAAPGVFGVGDIDGDGDLDVALSGDGDKRFFILEQLSPGVFATIVIEDPLGQAGGMKIVDLDGDGDAEVLVTGYEDNVVYLYEWNG